MANKRIVFGQPAIGQEEIDEVVDSLKSGWIGTGPKVARFENSFKDYKKIKNAVALSSCTAALHLALIILGIKKDDEVLVPAMTFAATANSVIHAGGKPIFVDSDPLTWTMDPKDMADKINAKTKAIIVVHFAGRMADMDKIMSIAKKNNLRVIEDCAHAIEAKHTLGRAGTIGDFGCFSFYATKNLTTAEGGMLVTDNESWAKKARILSMHGQDKDAWRRHKNGSNRHYYITEAGYKYNMTDLQASLGIHQLARLGQNLKKREKIWNKYNRAFKDLPVQIPAPVAPGHVHARHLYQLILKTDRLSIDRDKFMELAEDKGIGVGLHYLPVHRHPFYAKRNIDSASLKNAEYIGERTVSLPFSSFLSDQEADYIIETVRDILNSRHAP